MKEKEEIDSGNLKILWISLLIIFSGAFLMCMYPPNLKIEMPVNAHCIIHHKFNRVNPVSPKIITKGLVWDYIRNHADVQFPYIVWKQVIKETGLTARWVWENNNLTCMRLPLNRPTFAEGEQNGFALFNSWRDCIDDYKLFQDGFSGNSEDDYYGYLKTYCDSTYADSLRTFSVVIPKISEWEKALNDSLHWINKIKNK